MRGRQPQKRKSSNHADFCVGLLVPIWAKPMTRCTWFALTFVFVPASSQKSIYSSPTINTTTYCCLFVVSVSGTMYTRCLCCFEFVCVLLPRQAVVLVSISCFMIDRRQWVGPFWLRMIAIFYIPAVLCNNVICILIPGTRLLVVPSSTRSFPS